MTDRRHWRARLIARGTQAPFLKSYDAYCSSHALAMSTMNRCLLSGDRLKAFLKDIQARGSCDQTLDSLLLMPIQRIPRYNLLLQDLLKHTPETHPDYANLREATDGMRMVAEYLNENVRRIENERKLVEIEIMFGGEPVVRGRCVEAVEWVHASGTHAIRPLMRHVRASSSSCITSTPSASHASHSATRDARVCPSVRCSRRTAACFARAPC